MEPCCVCSCSLVCDCVAYSGLQSPLGSLTVICFRLYFLPPGINFIRAVEECFFVPAVGLMWCLSQLLFTSLTCHLYFLQFFLNICLTPPRVSCPPMSSPRAPPQLCSSSFSTSVLYSFIILFSPLPSPF